MIEAIDLTVRRRGRIVLDAVSFDVRPGQVTGVLGGSGAGKTTLLRRMVELERGGGETLFDGRPYRSLRHPMREVGLLLEPGAGHPRRTVRDHLRLALATDPRAAREGNGAAVPRPANRAVRPSTRAAARPTTKAARPSSNATRDAERAAFGASGDGGRAQAQWHADTRHDDLLTGSRRSTPAHGGSTGVESDDSFAGSQRGVPGHGGSAGVERDDAFAGSRHGVSGRGGGAGVEHDDMVSEEWHGVPGDGGWADSGWADGGRDDAVGGGWRGVPAHHSEARVGGWRRLADRLVVTRSGSPAERIDAVLDIVGLTQQSETRLADLTDGMATRLGIAVALLGDPKALLFDSPERGLGPEGVAWLGALLRAFTAQGRAALVTGSDTETLVGLADRLLLLDSGYLVGTRTAEEVLRAPTGAAVIVRSPQIVRFASILAEAGARSAQGDGACLEVHGLDRARVGDLAYRHGIPVHELSERFTGSDPGDVVLAACSGRNKPIVPLQGFPETDAEVAGILASIVSTSPPGSAPGAPPGSADGAGAGAAAGSASPLWIGEAAEGLSAMQPPGAASPETQSSAEQSGAEASATQRTEVGR